MSNTTINKNIDKIQVVTSNTLVLGHYSATLHKDAKKILYLFMAQVRMKDKEFSIYEIQDTELAELINTSVHRLNNNNTRILDELLYTSVIVETSNDFLSKHCRLMEIAEYQDHIYKFKLSKDLAPHLLHLGGFFTKPILANFLEMTLPASIDIWHLLQMKMCSKLPLHCTAMVIEVTVEELRKATGNVEKNKKFGHFYNTVVKPAMYEICNVTGLEIVCEQKKKGASVVSFICAITQWKSLKKSYDIKQQFLVEEKARYLKLLRKYREDKGITQDEEVELDQLSAFFENASKEQMCEIFTHDFYYSYLEENKKRIEDTKKFESFYKRYQEEDKRIKYFYPDRK